MDAQCKRGLSIAARKYQSLGALATVDDRMAGNCPRCQHHSLQCTCSRAVFQAPITSPTNHHSGHIVGCWHDARGWHLQTSVVNQVCMRSVSPRGIQRHLRIVSVDTGFDQDCVCRLAVSERARDRPLKYSDCFNRWRRWCWNNSYSWQLSSSASGCRHRCHSSQPWISAVHAS